MSTELGQPLTVVSPRTGEVLALDAPTADLGGYLADVREFESLLKEAKGLVNRELLKRLDFQREWTCYTENGLKLSAPSDEPAKEYDAVGLREALLALVDAGSLAVEAVDAAVEVVVSYKVHAKGINALRKRQDLALVVDACCETVEKQRYVKVSRA